MMYVKYDRRDIRQRNEIRRVWFGLGPMTKAEWMEHDAELQRKGTLLGCGAKTKCVDKML